MPDEDTLPKSLPSNTTGFSLTPVDPLSVVAWLNDVASCVTDGLVVKLLVQDVVVIVAVVVVDSSFSDEVVLVGGVLIVTVEVYELPFVLDDDGDDDDDGGGDDGDDGGGDSGGDDDDSWFELQSSRETTALTGCPLRESGDIHTPVMFNMGPDVWDSITNSRQSQ